MKHILERTIGVVAIFLDNILLSETDTGQNKGDEHSENLPDLPVFMLLTAYY